MKILDLVIRMLPTVFVLVCHVPVIAADLVFYPATKTPATTISYSASTVADKQTSSSAVVGEQAFITIAPYYSQAGEIKGGGSINGPGFDCLFVNGGIPDGLCSQYIPIGTQITLAAAPDANSVFYGWGGEVCNGSSCIFTVQGNATVNAYFAAAYRILDNANSGYNSITEALTGTGTEIRVRQRFNPTTLAPEDYTEDITIDRTVEIKGGYTATFDDPGELMTTIQGVVIIGSGSLTVGGIAIK